MYLSAYICMYVCLLVRFCIFHSVCQCEKCVAKSGLMSAAWKNGKNCTEKSLFLFKQQQLCNKSHYDSGSKH